MWGFSLTHMEDIRGECEGLFLTPLGSVCVCVCVCVCACVCLHLNLLLSSLSLCLISLHFLSPSLPLSFSPSLSVSFAPATPLALYLSFPHSFSFFLFI